MATDQATKKKLRSSSLRSVKVMVMAPAQAVSHGAR